MKHLSPFLFLIFFSLYAQAQGKAGYVIVSKGDTIIGNIKVLRNKPIQFYQNEQVTVYQKDELLDYGYLETDKYISKPEKIPPKGKRKKTTLADIILMTGDTLYSCYVSSCNLDFMQAYVEYPKKEFFGSIKGRVKEIILYEGDFTIHVDLIKMKYSRQRGEFHNGYAVRAVDGIIRQYNSRFPFTGTIYSPLTPGATHVPFALEDFSFKRSPVILSNYDKWILHKEGEIYRFNTFKEWEKIRPLLIGEDEEFEKYLKEKRVNQRRIELVLHAYNTYYRNKYGDKN